MYVCIYAYIYTYIYIYITIYIEMDWVNPHTKNGVRVGVNPAEAVVDCKIPRKENSPIL